MTESFDVIVAGAGPAGAQCARDLGARGYDTLVLESECEAEFPRRSDKSTAGTFPSTMTEFGVPDEVVMNATDAVVIESPNDYYRRTQTGAVLDFAAFKRWLVSAGRDSGVEYRFDAHVTGAVTSGGRVVGVEYNGSNEVYADVVIDATGPIAAIAEDLDVVELRTDNRAVGVEYEMRGVTADHPRYGDLTDAMMLRLDQDVAPGGYSWIFHTGEDTAKVGLCYIQNGAHSRYADADRTIDEYLQRWIEADPRLSEAERIDGRQHRGAAHVQLPGSMCTDNFIAIGDTVPTVDPLWGEGIAKCMQSGRAAAITVDDCLGASGDGGAARDTSYYEKHWRRDIAPNVRRRFYMTQALYRAPNERYDELIADLRGHGDDTLERANEGDLLALARLLKPSDARLALDYVSDRLSNAVPSA